MTATATASPVWSATRLKTFLTCPRKYRYAYVEQIPAVLTAPLVLGRVLHETLCFLHEHQMEQGRFPAASEAVSHFDALWNRALQEDEPFFRFGAPSPQAHREIAHKALFAFLWTSENSRSPLVVEMAFQVEAGEHTLCGVIDRVDEGENGLIIVDFKSGARKPTVSEAERDLQLTLYAFAAEKVLGQKVERVVQYHLRDGSQVSTERSADDFAWLLDEVVPHVANAVASERFAPCYGYWCNWCDFRELCRAENDLANNRVPERNVTKKEDETIWLTPSR